MLMIKVHEITEHKSGIGVPSILMHVEGRGENFLSFANN